MRGGRKVTRRIFHKTLLRLSATPPMNQSCVRQNAKEKDICNYMYDSWGYSNTDLLLDFCAATVSMFLIKVACSVRDRAAEKKFVINYDSVSM